MGGPDSVRARAPRAVFLDDVVRRGQAVSTNRRQARPDGAAGNPEIERLARTAFMAT